ncbi:TetR/AcrR family transcriptional regulator [Nocardioides sp. W7]|uniref:TetR/AcrR family transcriptional regulator n=1 Tax=Nocardioides sp. W7 TaxID=2931390 RepID=UPI002468435C|nr:TetR/AcrR family transcriptional regulator [Nocardioides sp. W7]
MRPASTVTVAEARRASIMTAGGRLFSEHGVAGTSVRQIADAVGLVPSSLYHHFPSKESIASELILRFVNELNDEYTRLRGSVLSGRDQLHELITVSLRVAAEHPFATETYVRELPNLSILPDHEAIAAVVRRNEVLWSEKTHQGIEDGAFRADIDVDTMNRTLSEMVWLTVRWNRADLAARQEELARELFVLITEGYRVRPT